MSYNSNTSNSNSSSTPPAPYTLLDAALTNNEGVRVLESGDSAGAMQIFQHGVESLNALIMTCCRNGICGRTLRSASSLSPFIDTLLLNAVSDPSNQRIGLRLHGLQYDLCFVYDRPLLLSPENIDITCLTSTAYILFNFALACHQYSRLTGDEARRTQAAELYDMLIFLLCHTDQNNFMLMVVKCLAINNIAVLHYVNDDYPRSQQYVAYMYQHMSLTGCLEHVFASFYLSTLECEELKLNLFHIQPPATARAA